MDITKTPNHIAIIPDGNRRWAKEKGLPSIEGHRQGIKTATEIARKVRSMGIHTLTLWAFSTENWERGQEEVTGFFRLGASFVDHYLKEALKDGVKIVHLGRKDRMPDYLLEKINTAEEKTSHFTDYILNIAFDYGGQDEVIRAIKKMNDSGTSEISGDTLASFLDTGNQPYPNPDIIIRTSGEHRTSGFMIWQAAYAEYFFLNKYFPDLEPADIEKIIHEYTTRERRFGA